MLRRKLITLAILLLLVAVLYIPDHAKLASVYDSYIYYPLQSLRGILFGWLPVSFGDILYLLAGILAVTTLFRWVYYLVHFRSCKLQLASSALSSINIALLIYLLFIIGWGANYDKQPLKNEWGLAVSKTDSSYNPQQTLEHITEFESFLTEKLNTYAPGYRSLSFGELNEQAKNHYKNLTDSKVKKYGLHIKPTIYAYVMERLAIEGYYNPFTGEGQVCTTLPSFMLPFVISHEMAHQAGIAAEGDANLMAYALGTAGDDSIFRYSAYLNIWIYNTNRLMVRDSLAAKNFRQQLNTLTLSHLDTLKQLSRKYDNNMARYSSKVYDQYLKLEAQHDGIRSYGHVSTSARLLEQKRMKGWTGLIHVP